MKSLHPLLLALLFAVVPAEVRPADGVPAAAIAARAKQTRARIDLLFRHRNEPPEPLDPSQNPFRTPSDGSTITPSITPTSPVENQPPAELTSDDVLLKRAVATLKISGTVVIGDQVHVTINQETYKEGGIITARVGGVPVYLRIRRITTNSVTFALNESQMVQPF